jgi:hypothetical protein
MFHEGVEFEQQKYRKLRQFSKQIILAVIEKGPGRSGAF